VRRRPVLLLQVGAPITYVNKQLGHADASITMRVYAHYLPDGATREVDRLDAVQSPTHPDGISGASGGRKRRSRSRAKCFG
jgi:hypothetical protein